MPRRRNDESHRNRASARRAERDAEKLAASFEKAAARVRRQRAPQGHATDPGAVHDLRVASRRLSSALGLWRPMLDRKQRRAVARPLRRIRRAFGPVREIEVHLAGLEHLGKTLARAPRSTRTALTALDRTLRERYVTTRNEALATLKPHRARRVGQKVERAYAELPGGFKNEQARAKVEARLRAARDAAHEAIRAASRPGLSPENDAFHQARIAIKKWRYAVERHAKAVGRDPKALAQLRQLQNALGKAHDAVTLDAEVARFVTRSPARRRALVPVTKVLRTEARKQVAQFLTRAKRVAEKRSEVAAKRDAARRPQGDATPRRAPVS